MRLSGSWYPNGSPVHSGGSAVLSMENGSRATLTFNGTGIKWIGYKDEWAGKASVALDGGSKKVVDTYASPAQAQAVLFSATGLSGGSHTLTIKVTGSHSAASSGDWVWVDAFEVTP